MAYGMNEQGPSSVAPTNGRDAVGEDGRLPVLIVDDDPHIVTALERALRRSYTIFTASTAEESLDVLSAEDIAIVLADQVLTGSGMQGDELLRTIHERSPETVSIMISGQCEPDDLIRAVNGGHIFAFIGKPWMVPDLQLALAKASSVVRLQRDNRRLVGELQTLNDQLAERVRAAVAELQRKNELLEEVTSKLEQRNRMLGELAVTDELTGLYNLRYLQLRLDSELERFGRYKTRLACILLDIDDFKRVNDTHGHLTGNRAIVAVSDVLKTMARRTDVVGRYGGEEFLVICPSTTVEGAAVLAERIRVGVEEIEIELETGGVLRMTLSGGVSAIPYAEPKVESMLGMADAGLYVAKRGGKNRIVVSMGEEK